MENGSLALLGAIIIIYLAPWWIAGVRRHRSVLAIGFVTLFLGWTGIGWLWAIIWALTGNVRHAD